MPEINSKIPEAGSEATKNRYLQTDKKVNLQEYLQKMDKEEKSGLKGIEVRETPKQLGKDDFLKLLITQLSKQDPTNPLKDQDFIAQMANFSSLEQMKNISTGIQKLEARQNYNLIGKIVSGPDFVNGEMVTGIVGAIFFDKDGKSFARVNGRTLEIEKINFISDPAMLQAESDAENSGQIQKGDSTFSENDRSNKGESKNNTGDWNFPGGKKTNGYNE
jgi:flagellar basal-body rod modification protein FlgD